MDQVVKESKGQNSIGSSNQHDSALSSICIIGSDKAILSRHKNRLPCLIKLNRRHNSIPSDFYESDEPIDQRIRSKSMMAQVTSTNAQMDTEPIVTSPTSTNRTTSTATTSTNGLVMDDQERQIAIPENETTLAPQSMGDSLIELVINLKNENQNLARALEVNNEYVRRRLVELREFQAETRFMKQRFDLEKQDMIEKIKKLTRQNQILNERLRIMDHEQAASNQLLNEPDRLYPDLSRPETLHLMLPNSSHGESKRQPTDQISSGGYLVASPQSPMQVETKTEESSKQSDDPMQQCDRLEQKLNGIGKRDYEICLLQQQLNIYRQDFRLERMAKLEAQLQIEQLKNDIDRLCFDRSQQQQQQQRNTDTGPISPQSAPLDSPTIIDNKIPLDSESVSSPSDNENNETLRHHRRGHHHRKNKSHRRHRNSVPDDDQKPPETLGRRASRSALKAAAKAAKYASTHYKSTKNGRHEYINQNHKQSPAEATGERPRNIKNEVVNDFITTANKAMITGYKMASTHVNLALERLGQYEPAQGSSKEK